MKIVGKPFNGFLTQPQDEVTGTVYGETISRRFRAVYATFRSYLPPIGASHPVNTLCLFKTYSARQLADGYACEVQLNYVQDEIPSTTALPSDEISESGSTIEIDIRSHPNFKDGFDAFWDKEKNQFYLDLAPEYLRGVTKYVVGSGQVAITTFSHSRPPSQIPLYGKKADPGHGVGSDGYWLCMTGGVSKRGGFWATTLVYQYSSKPVPDEIYAV